MGQRPFHWFRPFSRGNRDKQKQTHLQQQDHSFYPQQPAHHQNPHPPFYANGPYDQPLHNPLNPEFHRDSDSNSGPPSTNSSTVPYHASTPRSPRSPVPPPHFLTADVNPVPPSSPPPPATNRSARRVRGDRGKRPVNNYDATPFSAPPSGRHWRKTNSNHRIAFGRRNNHAQTSPASDPLHSYSVNGSPALTAFSGPDSSRSPAFARLDGNARHLEDRASFDVNQLQPPSFASDLADSGVSSTQSSVVDSAVNSATGALDNFVPHRPEDRFAPAFNPTAQEGEFRYTLGATTPEVTSIDSVDVPPGTTERRGRYHKKLADPQSRFIFRRRAQRQPSREQPAPPPSDSPDDYFGATQHDDGNRTSEIRPGEEVLIKFLRNTLGPKAQNFAVRLMNKTPITSSSSFSYVIHQGTEESDIDIIRRDLTSGRLYSSGVRLLGGGWCNLLLGDRFAPGTSSRQRHELTYRRSSCSCIICRVRAMELAKAEADVRSQSEFGSEVESNGISADVLSTMSSSTRTPTHSAMANFVVRYKLPESSLLMGIGASSSTRELEIGSVVRLNYRASAKLKFTDDVRELFGHYAYTGPISHEEVYRRVTTIGVHYYLYNKGKKERKVYIQGELIRLPINIGVIKLGTQPMFMPELGATFCLHRKQIMSIYVGEIVLEGNSIGSFIKTGIRYYIGFGEERGVCPVYPNKTLGKARKLGINELLLHHHMVDDLEVKCL